MRVGVASALLTAISPWVLTQLSEPSAHLPAAAAWTVAVAFVTSGKPRHVLWSGLAAAVAILLAPSLFQLVAVIALFVLFRPERTRSQRTQAALTYIAAAVVGYAIGAVLFALGHFQRGSADYLDRDFEGPVRWLAALDLAIAGLALLAPVVVPGALTVLLLGMCVVTVIVDLPYTSLTHWSSLRGLLPALPLALVLGAAVVDAGWRRWILPRRDASQMAHHR